MWSITTLVAVILASGMSLVQAMPSPGNMPPSTSMTYTGPHTPGGEDVTLVGTAEEVHAQILKLNPNFNPDDFVDNSTIAARNAAEEIRMEKRNKDGLICNIPGVFSGSGTSWAIGGGASYLQSLPGRCSVGAGPRTCVRISCSYNSGIYLCNDNNYPIDPSCAYLGSYAQDIIGRCTQTDLALNGQEFDSDNYNIIAAWGDC